MSRLILFFQKRVDLLLDLIRLVSYKENDMHEWVDRSKAWVDSKILNGQKWVFKMYFGQSKPFSYEPKVPIMIKCNIDIYEMLIYARTHWIDTLSMLKNECTLWYRPKYTVWATKKFDIIKIKTGNLCPHNYVTDLKICILNADYIFWMSIMYFGWILYVVRLV